MLSTCILIFATISSHLQNRIAKMHALLVYFAIHQQTRIHPLFMSLGEKRKEIGFWVLVRSISNHLQNKLRLGASVELHKLPGELVTFHFVRPSHVKLMLANSCWQNSNWCVCVCTKQQHVGKLLATNRTCLYSRQ